MPAIEFCRPSACLREMTMTTGKRLFGLLLAASTVLATGAALAADYDPPVFEAPVVEDEYVPVEVGSGWYLRGDVGYVGKASMGDVNYRTFDPLTSTYGNSSFDTTGLGEDWTYGIGFGYRFTDYLRADATWDMFGGDFSGSTSSATECPGEAVGTGCRTEDSAGMDGMAFMANAYVDLATFKGFTPYLGVGAGMAKVEWNNLTNQPYCVDLGGPACSGLPLTPAIHPGISSWRFAYSFMAGVGYDINNFLKLDVGYRYRAVAGGDMFGWDAATAASGASGIQGTDDGFGMHEVKVGLRYELW